ncbi:MAG: sugar ABC transporter permease [Chloroflexi bacterium]|nr:sugar ABC transporter permease [Chloroflexota bacterium]
MLPALIYVLLFNYAPMYGLQIAFKDFRSSLGIWRSSWVGLKHFATFIKYPGFWHVLWNTFSLSAYQLVAGFPAPIILAILMNEAKHKGYKKTVQMVTYAPYFISTVVLCGMITLFLNENIGMINNIIASIGGERHSFITDPKAFRTIYVVSGIWQNAGWGTIIYLATLSTVSVDAIEAARLDGTTRLQKIWYIDLPALVPTIVILLIMDSGRVLSVGFEKAFLLQNAVNLSSSDIIATYVYRMGLLGAQFSYSSAIGLFNTAINLVALLAMNTLARRYAETSLW